jgi:hypothetical protein
MHPTSQNAAVTTGRLIKPINFHGLGDCLRWNAMVRRQEVGSPILGKIVQQGARADVRPIIVKNKPSNGVLFGIAVT